MAQQNSSEEVDLGYLFKGIGNFFRAIVKLLFLVIAFFRKFIILVVALIILGAIFGYFLDRNSKNVYENRIIVIPNYESVEYLYDKIDEINYKISNNDSVYMKSVFGPNYVNIIKIEIEPIIDIYNFVTKSRENIDAFRILFENQDMKEFVEDMPTSKQYKYQKLKVYILGKESKPLIEKLFTFFNENKHFNEYQKVYQENTEERLFETDKMIVQADSVIKAITSISKGISTSPPVYASFNNDFYSIFRYKQVLLTDKLELLKKSKDEIVIIKPVSMNYNIFDKGIFSIRDIFKIPILLVILFSLIFFIRFIYLRLKAIAERD